MDYPQFKYHPNAYKLDIFIKEDGICSVCKQQRNLKYNCSFYSIDKPDYICPWCIENGEAAKTYDGQFNDYCGIEGVSPNPNDPPSTVDAKLLNAICTQTPSYLSWQQQVWLVHCNQPCQFIDYANSEILEPIWDEIIEDIKNSGYPIGSVKNYLSKDGEFVGYLFQCINCHQYRLHIDCS